MFRVIALFVIFILFIPLPRLQAQQGTPTTEGPNVAIAAPLPGQALQGSVPISGRTQMDGFRRAELSFTYQDDPRQTWFLIKAFDEPVDEGRLTDWDTTTLTDGVYQLRLIIFRDEGRDPVEIIVSGLRVRNYTPIETDTPTPIAPTATTQPGDTPVPTSTATVTLTPIPLTPTLLPTNPAVLTDSEIAASLGQGVLVVGLAFALGAVYLGLRTLIRRRRDR
jgi:hypothetical protein